VAETTAVQKSKLDAERQALRAQVANFRRQVAADGESLMDEARRFSGPESPLAEHPKATVAASAAVGFVAARAPAHVPKPHVPGPTPVKKVAGKGASAGLDVLKVEAGVAIRDLVDGMFDGGKEKRQGDSLAAG
jgi:hypothetical protein